MSSYLRRMFERSGHADRTGESLWKKLAADVLGPVMELLWRMLALLLLGAAILPVLRGRPDLLVGVPALAAGLAILALLSSRIVRTTYDMVIVTPGQVHLVVRPVAASFFLVDAAWLAAGARWLWPSAQTVPGAAAIDPAFDLGGPAIMLTLTAVLLGLRIWSRIRAD